MKRAFFGLCAIGSGLAAIHFTTRWLQLGDTTRCMGDARCAQMIQRGGETRNDRRMAIGLFVLAGVCVLMAGGRDHH